MEYLGMKLKALRQARGITQAKLAEIAGVVTATISSYETGGNYPSVEILIKLCRYFDVSADYLLGLKDTRKFNMTDLTDDQFQSVLLIIEQFRQLNNRLDDE